MQSGKNYAKITQKLRNVFGNAELRKNYANYAKITQITQVTKNYADYAPPTLLMIRTGRECITGSYAIRGFISKP